MADPSGRPSAGGVAMQWRERRLRSMLRHEQQTVRLALAAFTHHRAQRQKTATNFGSPNGSVPELERVGGRSTSTMEEKFEAILAKIFSRFEIHLGALASIPMLVQGFTRFENSILSHTQSVASITHNISNIEQAVGGLAARVAALEAGAASGLSGSGWARSWSRPGHSDGSTATGSHGPGASHGQRN